MKRIKRELRKYLTYISILLCIMLIFLVFQIDIVSIIVVGLLILLACFSKVYKRWTAMSIGFEFVTPVVIIFGYKIGIVFAMVSAIFMVIAAEFISGKMVFPSVLMQCIAYVIVSVVASLFSGMSFIPLAISLIVFRNLFLFVVAVFFWGTDPFKMFISTLATNIFINSFIIFKIGEFVIQLL